MTSSKLQRYVYDNGLPFSHGLDYNLDDLQNRIDCKKASLVIVDGGVGEGKTTLGVHAAEYFQKSEINFRYQYSMGGVQFQERLQICVDGNLVVVIYDEAGDFSRRGALTEFNKMLNRIFETYRGFKILVIIILPNFGVLDKQLFDNMIPRLLLHCSKRNNNYGNYAGYSLWRMFYLRDKMKKLTVPPQAYDAVEPNFRGHFLDLKPTRSAELEKVSLEGKSKVLSQNILSARGLISTRDLMKKLHRSRPWVTEKIRKLSLKANHIYKKQRYYDKGVLERLKDEIQ